MKRNSYTPLLLAVGLAAASIVPAAAQRGDAATATPAAETSTTRLAPAFTPAPLTLAAPADDDGADWAAYSAGRHHGPDFTFETGLAAHKGGVDGSFLLSIGKRFNPYFYFGGGTGYTVGKNISRLPLFLDFKGYIPTGNPHVQPFGLVRLGYAFNFKDGNLGRDADLFQFQITPGVQFPLNQRLDLSLGLGYRGAVMMAGGQLENSFVLHTALGLHKGLAPRPKKPIRQQGLQLTIEGDLYTPWKWWRGSDNNKAANGMFGFDVSVTYKKDAHLSFGLGYGVGIHVTGQEYTGYGYEMEDEVWFLGHSLYARGQWRLTDSRFTPLVNVDLGYRFYGLFDSMYADEAGAPRGSFFIKPSVGFSVRTNNNTYFDLKLGYDLSQKIKGGTVEQYGRSVEYKNARVPGAFISIGFTHTFKRRIKALDNLF